MRKKESNTKSILWNPSKVGISLISLIITIIVIIILAAIVIFTGLNTPDRANFAKFVQEFSDFRTAVQQDFMQKKAQYAIEGKSRSDAQIYYSIAVGSDTLKNAGADINLEPTVANAEVEQYTGTEIKALIGEDGLGLEGLDIKGTYAYRITDDKNVLNWKQDKKYYAPTETHWITDEGDVFILTGYRVEQDGKEKWYLNETVASNTEIAGPLSPSATFIGIYSNSACTNPAGTGLSTSTKTYVKFEVNGNGRTISSVSIKGTPLTSTGTSDGVNTYVYQTTTNASPLIAKIETSGKTYRIPITNITNYNLKTLAQKNIKVGDYIKYPIDSKSIDIPGSEWGSSLDQSITNNTAVNWVVWKVDGDKVTIIPSSPVSKTRLHYGICWVNSMNILNKVCKELYASEDIFNVKEDDIECMDMTHIQEVYSGDLLPSDVKMAFYRRNPDDITESGYIPQKADRPDSNNLARGYRFYIYKYSDGSILGNIHGGKGNGTGYKVDEFGAEYVTVEEGYPVYVTNTYIFKKPATWKPIAPGSSKTYGNLLGNEIGWLAYPSVYVVDSWTVAEFNVSMVNSEKVTSDGLYVSSGFVRDLSYGVRPLVSLSSSLYVSSGSGTSTKPYVLSR